MFKVDKNADVNGSSFHMMEVVASPELLTEVFGKAAYDENYGDDKVNMEWTFSDDEGNPFTLYDWKHYHPLDMGSRVHWHIGSRTPELEDKFLDYVNSTIAEYIEVEAGV